MEFFQHLVECVPQRTKAAPETPGSLKMYQKVLGESIFQRHFQGFHLGDAVGTESGDPTGNQIIWLEIKKTEDKPDIEREPSLDMHLHILTEFIHRWCTNWAPCLVLSVMSAGLHNSYITEWTDGPSGLLRLVLKPWQNFATSYRWQILMADLRSSDLLLKKHLWTCWHFPFELQFYCILISGEFIPVLPLVSHLFSKFK